MTEQQMPLERMIAGWMADEAVGAPEALLEQILGTTARTTPRPRVWALAAEPTLRGRTTRAAVGLPNRRLVLLAVLALVLAGLLAVAVGARLLLEPKPGVTGDWPGFRGNADHIGVGLEGPTGNPVQNWQFHATGAVLEVAVVGDRAYFASDDGTLHAVSRDRGITQWAVPAGPAPLVGPYAGEGRLYLTDSNGAVRAFDQKDGSTLWTSASTYNGPSRLISVDGTLYLGTVDGQLVAVDAATGAERWRVAPVGATAVDAPAFGSGLVFAGTTGAGFVAIDPATHQVVWVGETNDEDTGTATVADGIAYIGPAADATSGKLRAFEAKTGRPLWIAEEDLLEIPTVANGVAFSGTVDGTLAAIDTATGKTKWRIHVPSEVRPPVVVNGIVYLSAGTEHRVYAVDAASGGQLWHFDVDANANCCLAVAKGALYVGTDGGSVYSIGGDGGSVAAVPFPTNVPPVSPKPVASATPVPTPAATFVPVTYPWATDLRGKGFAPICQIAVDPSGRIWAPEADTGKIAILGPDGSLLDEWAGQGPGDGQFDFTRGNGDCYGTLAFEKDGSFFVLDVGNWRVQAFDKNRRFVRAWGAFGSRPGEFNDPIGIAVASDGSVWVLDGVRLIAERYDRTGKVVGSFEPFVNAPVNKGANALAIGPNGHFYVAQIVPNQIAEFDANGIFIRAYGQAVFPNEQPTQIAVDADGRVFVTQGSGRGGLPGVTVFAADGSILGGFGPVGSGDGQMSFPAGIALDETGTVYVMDGDPESARMMKIKLVAPLVP